MKLIRFGQEGQEKPGIIDQDGNRRDISVFGQQFDETFFGTDGIERLSDWISTHLEECPIIPEDVRWGSPLSRPSKIVCIGLNYAKHAAEAGAKIPKEPIVFFKATSAICGPFDQVMIPKGSEKTEWEVELAIVIGKKATYVSEENAMDHVAGYTIHNDYSEREFQLERKGQWVKGKSADTFAPLGPFVATRDEIPNPNSLRLWLTANGEKLQDSNTDDMIFNVPFLVHYVSQFMSLLPGDIISTGTPSGVAMGFEPPRYLRGGEEIELGIEGLGVMKQKILPFSGS